VNLHDFNIIIQKVNEVIGSINKKIKQIIELKENIDEEKEKLSIKVWNLLANKLEDEYKHTAKQLEDNFKAANGILNNIESNEAKINTNKEAIKDIERDIISTSPSKEIINDLLKKFGFTGFKLDDSEKEGYYRLIREDGSVVEETLSEGEKTFITFLYFYARALGINQEQNSKKIIVIDDPISSLDSDVMFVVSQLIKELKYKIESNQNTEFVQMFILTHNLYFHKEITYKPSGDSTENQYYWILRKENNKSTIEAFENQNPIKNSYALLWEEMMRNKDSNLLPNILRRILEIYFRHFGGRNIDSVIEEFDSTDKIICDSLVKWAHDGSHHYQDELYMQHRASDNKMYLDVFKEIFNKTNHLEHYEMMLNETNSNEK